MFDSRIPFWDPRSPYYAQYEYQRNEPFRVWATSQAFKDICLGSPYDRNKGYSSYAKSKSWWENDIFTILFVAGCCVIILSCAFSIFGSIAGAILSLF